MSELPQNRDAERALIGACLIATRIEGTAEIVKAEQFTDRVYRFIWGSMLELHQRGDPLDIVTVASKLVDLEDISETDAPILLMELMGVTPSSAHMDKYAELVIVTDAKRKLALALPALSKIAYGDERYELAGVFADARHIIEKASEGIQHLEREQWSMAELAALEIEEDPFILDDFIIGGGLNLLAGPSGSGKTWLALDLALGYYTGTIAWGKRCKRGRVLYFGADNARDDLVQRSRELCAGREIKPPHDGFTFDFTPMQLSDPAAFAIIRQEVLKHDAGLVIVDAVVRYMGKFDENSAADVGQIMAGFRSICNELGVALLIVHHLAKPGGNVKRNLGDMIRGSGDWKGGADSAIVLNIVGAGASQVRTVVQIKSRRSQEYPAVGFSILTEKPGALVLGFEAASAQAVATTLVDTVAGLFMECLQKNPGVGYPTSDLKQYLESVGMEPSKRTLQRSFEQLRMIPKVAVSKTGHENCYVYNN